MKGLTTDQLITIIFYLFMILHICGYVFLACSIYPHNAWVVPLSLTTIPIGFMISFVRKYGWLKS